MRRNLVLGVGFTAVIAAAGAGWIGGRQIKSPSEVASRTAPPAPSVIVAPVEKRALASEVVVRGTVRYGAPQAVTLATSAMKKAQDTVTAAPTKGAELVEGDVAMAASARPVFVLRGDKPNYRDIGPGSSGTDVEQLEKALVRLGFDPGPVDGTYDGRTATAVAAMYAGAGWAPFGPTDEQAQAVRAAQADDFTAKSDLMTQQEALAAAKGVLATAQDRASRAARAKTAANATDAAAVAKAEHERLAAAADVASRSAALDAAIDADGVAKVALDEAVAGTVAAPTKLELATVQAAAKQATRAVTTARADLVAALAGLNAVAAPEADAAAKDAGAEVAAANAEVARSQLALDAASSKLALYEQRPSAGVLDQLTSKMGVQVPADEIVFFPNLPLRVDAVKLAAGDVLSGPFMTVTNSRLAIDGALSLDDTRLVKAGSAVTITEAELGIKLTGTVAAVASAPGTDGADPQRFHIEVAPSGAPTSLVGASVVMNITVNSTLGEVLSVPVPALSVAADGTSRVQVQAADKSTSYVTVTPGLTASGFVAVTPTGGALKPGDLVVVGVDAARSLAIKNAAGLTTDSTTGPLTVGGSSGLGTTPPTTPTTTAAGG